MAAFLPPSVGPRDPRYSDDASMLEPSVNTGHLIPYHTVSRPALRRVTDEGLRMAGIFTPAAHGAPTAATTIGASVSFSPGAKSHLPEIFGGHAARGDSTSIRSPSRLPSPWCRPAHPARTFPTP